MSMCHGKRRYPNRFIAELELQRIQDADGHKANVPCRVYKCNTCKGFHLTSMEKA